MLSRVVQKVLTPNRIDVLQRIMLAEKAMDQALVRARAEEDALLTDAVESVIAALEHSRAVALDEDPYED